MLPSFLPRASVSSAHGAPKSRIHSSLHVPFRTLVALLFLCAWAARMLRDQSLSSPRETFLVGVPVPVPVPASPYCHSTDSQRRVCLFIGADSLLIPCTAAWCHTSGCIRQGSQSSTAVGVDVQREELPGPMASLVLGTIFARSSTAWA